MPTMNVSLTSDMADYVSEELASGEYGSASEVVRDALRSLRREREVEREKLAILRSAVEVGMVQAERGEFGERTVSEIARGVLDKAR